MLRRLIIAYGVLAVAGAVVLAWLCCLSEGAIDHLRHQGVSGKKPLNVSSIRAQVSS